MQRAESIVNVLAAIGVMFTRQSEQEYCEMRSLDAWASAKLPSWPIRRITQNEVLVAGMPLAALPVESLYRPWSSASGNNYGAQRGMYLGDSAQHIQTMYDELGIEVPEAFAATPDHLTLLLDLLVLFLESGNVEAARNLATDHFGWLSAYDRALAARSEEAKRAAALDDGKKAAVGEGIAHLRALVARTDGLVREIAQGAGASGEANAGERFAVCGDGSIEDTDSFQTRR